MIEAADKTLACGAVKSFRLLAIILLTILLILRPRSASLRSSLRSSTPRSLRLEEVEDNTELVVVLIF